MDMAAAFLNKDNPGQSHQYKHYILVGMIVLQNYTEAEGGGGGGGGAVYHYQTSSADLGLIRLFKYRLGRLAAQSTSSLIKPKSLERCYFLIS